MKRDRFRKKMYFKAVSIRKNTFERYLAALSLGILFVLITAQIGLLLPEVRPELTDIEVYEGIDLAGVLPQSSFVLKAESSVAENAVVLVNGTPCGNFTDGVCEVTVLNRGLVEIDGRACEEEFSVSVDAVDPSLNGLSEGDTYLIGKSMTIIGRVEVTNN